MAVTGKLELVIKISDVPTDVTTTENGWKTFLVACGGRQVSVTVRPKFWTKIEHAAKDYPLWVAAIAGQMGPATDEGFVLLEPAIQVFERKAKATTPTPTSA